ncbi:hypothetical protein PG984_000994 [Apiospora sp. TS-2023a]
MAPQDLSTLTRSMAYVSVSTLKTWASTSPGSVRTQPGPGALDFSQGSSVLVLSVYATRTAAA